MLSYYFNNEKKEDEIDKEVKEPEVYDEKNKFQLPIYYLENKYKLADSVKTDLELVDLSNNVSLYKNILSNDNNKSETLINKWNEYYTTDKKFLLDSQEFLSKYKMLEKYQEYKKNIPNIQNILSELKNETGFYEKYKYIDIDYFKKFNRSSSVLQLLTLYNLTSPILSLAVPIIMLIMPFFILKIQGLTISFNLYVKTIVTLFKNHIIGQLFSRFSEADITQKIFLLFSIGFYFFSIYQNINSCYTFYKNIYKIRRYLNDIKNFIDYSIENIDNINRYSKSSYNLFVERNNNIKERLLLFKLELLKIDVTSFKITHIAKIGNILKCFYELYDNVEYKNALDYSIDMHYYLINIENLQNNIKKGKLNFCKFTTKKTNFSGAYFASLINETPVKNNYCLDKKIIITGPNAAGKTTILKTTLFNVILSQQIGLGCYKKANINIYRHIHSYINIPDTSQRDSLFQAEARRCKEILESLLNNRKEERHFCIFDEIYSGTNPSEAIASAYSFLNYISSYKNIDYILTTHYVSLCKLLDKNKHIVNKQMEVIDRKSTYKLDVGISNIKGGIKVLEDLKYEKEIIDGAKVIIDKIDI